MKFYNIWVELEEYDTVSEHYAICISFRYDCGGTLCTLSADRQLLSILFPQICSHFFFTFQNRFFLSHETRKRKNRFQNGDLMVNMKSKLLKFAMYSRLDFMHQL